MNDLVLVPGLNCTEALFSPQIVALGDAARCQVADHGSASSLEAIASAVLAAAPERFALAGLSMGGYVAFEMIRQAPERVTRLCLLDTRAAMDTPEDAERRRRTIALAEGGQFEKLHEILWPRLVHPARTGDAALEAVVVGMMRDTGPERFVRQQTAVLNRRDYRAVLEGISVPTTIIVGAQDEITPPAASREMQALISGAVVHEIAHCGHLSTLERPDEVSRLMRAWLAS
ncbi:MAG: alpha/beta fold hydrolase [Beijerinckiaceae bacterium]